MVFRELLQSKPDQLLIHGSVQLKRECVSNLRSRGASITVFEDEGGSFIETMSFISVSIIDEQFVG